MLVDARIAELRRVERPSFTWRQSEARLPQHPDVEEFLRSDRPHFVYAAFASVARARRFARDFFGGPSGGGPSGGYSAGVAVGGKGDTAYCEIVKTRAVHDARLRRYHAYQKELKKWLAYRRADRPDAAAAGASMPAPPPPPPAASKRSRADKTPTNRLRSKTVKTR